MTPLKGIEDFKGEVVHPAYWNDDVSVDNKRVALIGYGCKLCRYRLSDKCPADSIVLGSGVQIGPNIVDRVAKLYTWFRNRTYILPPPNQLFSGPGGANFKCMFEPDPPLRIIS